MGPGKKRKKILDQRIFEHSASWRSPFAPDSVNESKLVVLNRIGNSRELLSTPRTDINDRAPEVHRISNFSWWKLAACLIVIVALPFVIEWAGRVELRNTSTSNQITELPDGSKVNMTPGSELTYNKVIWLVNRRMDFEGAGYFEVAEGSVFRVNAVAGEVRVLGTTFSVWTKPHLFFVQCISGEVEVRTGIKKVNLKKDQFVTSDGEKSVSTSSAIRNIPILPESSAILTFEDIPLSAVFAQLTYSTGFIIHSELNPDWRYSGTLNAEKLEESLELLCKPFGATYQISASSLVSIKL